jgi:hypothetical protein
MIQVKCISRGERTNAHTDDLNCTWKGYRKTSAACFTLQDAFGDVWSRKVVTNSRTKVGCSFDTKLKMTEILMCIKLQVEALNHAFSNLVMNYSGTQLDYPRLTYNMIAGLVLDDFCPWESVDIGKGVFME